MGLFFILQLFFLLPGLLLLQTQGQGVGINYGQIANNLPSPGQVLTLLQSIKINRVKLYDADPIVLNAFSDSNVEFVIGLGNEYLYNMTDPNKAQTWIQTHVQPYINQTNITSITVGNEILTGNDTQLMSYLLPAMQNVYNALGNLGLRDQIMVTTANSVGILGNSYPPSSGTFQTNLQQFIQPILNFHAQINSPFLINAYPFFAYKDNPNEISLDYALFKPNQGMVDPNTNLHYDNMLFAQVDAVYAAMEKVGYSDIEVQISETGWPSKGDPDEIGANQENAASYNGNLLQKIANKEATPGKPMVPINVYVFALFNEDLKPGPDSERNYGLFYPDGKPVYNIGLHGGNLPELTYTSNGEHQWRYLGLIFYGLLNLLIELIMLV